MRDTNGSSASWIRRAIVLILALSIFCPPIACVQLEFSDAQPAAERQACRDNLKRIWLAVRQYVELHGDVPRENYPKFSGQALAEFLAHDTSGASMQCPAVQLEVGYFVNSTSAKQIMSTNSQGASPMIYDKPNNHRTKTSVVCNVLMSNGEILSVVVEGTKFWEWDRLVQTREGYDLQIRRLLKRKYGSAKGDEGREDIISGPGPSGSSGK